MSAPAGRALSAIKGVGWGLRHTSAHVQIRLHVARNSPL